MVLGNFEGNGYQIYSEGEVYVKGKGNDIKKGWSRGAMDKGPYNYCGFSLGFLRGTCIANC